MNDALVRQRAMVVQYPENELAQFSLGKALFDRGEYAEAREHLRRALSKRKDWMVVQILLGKIELQLGNSVGARLAFETARKLALDQNHQGPLAELDELLG